MQQKNNQQTTSTTRPTFNHGAKTECTINVIFLQNNIIRQATVKLSEDEEKVGTGVSEACIEGNRKCTWKIFTNCNDANSTILSKHI